MAALWIAGADVAEFGSIDDGGETFIDFGDLANNLPHLRLGDQSASLGGLMKSFISM